MSQEFGRKRSKTNTTRRYDLEYSENDVEEVKKADDRRECQWTATRTTKRTHEEKEKEEKDDDNIDDRKVETMELLRSTKFEEMVNGTKGKKKTMTTKRMEGRKNKKEGKSQCTIKCEP